MIRSFTICLFFGLLLFSCKGEKQQESAPEGTEVSIKYAKGFRITRFDGYTLVEVRTPWPDAKKGITYLLTEKGADVPENLDYDLKINVPIQSLVVTSTTHIPSLEALGVEDRLTGFPSTKYISSEKTRKNVDEGRIKELGNNESINTEMLLDLQPDVVIGFALDTNNKAYETIKNSGIPVVFNADWVEETPLGKAEWIKFFAPFFDKQAEADRIFAHIESEYSRAKALTQDIKERPVVLSGAMHKAVWILPGGKSWAAQFIKDAGGSYPWADTEDTGSLFLSMESVLDKAAPADFWISPTLFESYTALERANPHYTQFKPFQNKTIYTYSKTKGDGIGMLYFELGPNRPDIILKDLIRIFHPDKLPGYEPFFFKPLNP